MLLDYMRFPPRGTRTALATDSSVCMTTGSGNPTWANLSPVVRKQTLSPNQLLSCLPWPLHRFACGTGIES